MFFILSKIAYWLIMPTSLLAWLIIFSILVKKDRYKKKLRWVAFGLFLFFTNPFIATVTINTWEPEALLYEEIDNTYTYGIVLSGITNPNRPPFDRVQFNKGADRIVHAIDLYKKGIIEKILITGGSGTLTFEGNKEAHALKGFALGSGIPQSDIIMEDKARNTRENAQFSKELISETSDKAILITSAFHMYRARKCFEKVHLSVTPFPTDYYGRKLYYTPDDILIPSLYGLKIWTILTKEWIGIIAYKAAGFI
ncbi:YdcF family protein [Reichenbachiella sp.]|uniref:YdcF family protein n=1 Tax=Reichenbachiella sp. TaxID=2184521 RepID=UPI003BB0DE5A